MDRSQKQFSAAKPKIKDDMSECGSIVTSLSKAERMINTFDRIDVGPRAGPSEHDAPLNDQRSDLISQKRSVQEQI